MAQTLDIAGTGTVGMAGNRTPFAARDQCRDCHDRENSPAFRYTAYWSRIRHGDAAARKD